MTRPDVTRHDPSAVAVHAVLRAAHAAGRPWLGRGAVAALVGLPEGQAHAVLCGLAVDGLAQRGLVDDGQQLAVVWKAL